MIYIDSFKQSNNDKATSYGFYDKVVVQNTRTRSKDKRLLHKLARTRLKRDIIKESEEEGCMVY